MKFLSDILARAGLVVDGTVTLNSVANATTDTDRFIVVDSGVVKYRTGTQLLSDIGGISGNQTITLSGDATGSGTTSIAVTLANSGVTAGTYGSSTAVPVITVDAKGRVTGVTTASISGSLTFTGDVTGSGTTGSTTTLTLANSGVAAGTYNNVTVNAKGLVTSGSNVSYLTSYTETDTLASVTGRGAATSTVVTFSGGDGNNSSLKLAGYNQRGGAGYHGFLEATNTFGSATNPSKYFRLDSVGSLQIVNNAYTVAILTLTDAGALSVPGSVTAGSFVRSGGTSSQFLKADGSVDSTTYQSTSQKGQANGYASLDGAGKVPIAQLPSSIMEYKGTWNASTNSPSLADGTGDTGDVYRVSTAGTRNLGSGSITFDVGDYVIYNGTIWEKSDTTDAVASVNGFTGVITLTTTNIAEGTNLYYTDARARAALSFAAGSGAYNSSTGVITIPTNTNQLTNGAGFITSYTETDTLATVTGRGATTSTQVILNGGIRMGNAYLNPSGDLNHFHFNGTAIIPNTTTTASNASMGTASYRWSNIYGGGLDLSGSATVSGNVIAAKHIVGSTLGTSPIVVNASANESQILLKKSSQSSFSVLTWDGNIFLASNIYYSAGAWVHDAPAANNNNQLFVFTPGTGITWYASNNGSGSWNVANNITLWNDSGVWQRPVSSVSGTTNYISKFTSTTAVGNSQLYDDGTTVGVGTNTVYSWAKLQVAGTLAVGGILYIDDDYRIQGLTGFPGSASKLVLNSDGGNVGIGTTNPTSKLHVTGATDSNPTISIGTINANTGNAEIDFYSGTAGSNNSFTLRYTKTSSVDRIGFIDGGAIESFVIQNGGNVGIGTTSPSTKFHIVGTARVETGNVTLTQSYGITWNNGDNYIRGISGYHLQFTTYDGSASQVEVLRLTGGSAASGGGRVGIGTASPNRKLHVVSSDWDNTTGGGVIFENSNTVGSGLTLIPTASAVTNGTSGWAMYAGGPGAAIGDGNLGFWAHGTNAARLFIRRNGQIAFTAYTASSSFTGTAAGLLAFDSSGNLITLANNTYLTGNQTITLSGDATGSGATAITVTLANTGVTAGTYNNVTVDAKGRVTSASNVSYQSPLTNPVTGTGTTNYLTKFTGTTTVGNSQIFDNGTGVAIGTNSPGTAKLHIRGQQAATKDHLLSLSKFDYGEANFHLNYSNTFYTNGQSLEIEMYSFPLLQLAVNNGATQGRVVFPNGNVGIGSSSPSYKLQVVASSNQDGFFVSAADSSPFTAKIATFRYAANSNDICIEAQGGKAAIQARAGASTMDLLLNAAGGIVAIGTTSPQSGIILDARGGAAIAGGTEGLRIGNVGDNSAYDNVKIYYTGFNAGAPRIYLTPRTTPGSGIINTFLHLQNSNGSSTTSNNTMGLLVDGTVGIGTTSPSQRLEVNGNIRLTAGGFIYGDGANADLHLSNNGGSILRYGGVSVRVLAASVKITATSEEISLQNNNGTIWMNAAGNVGIANSSPTYTLQVGQNTGGNNTDYGILIARHGNGATPGTYTATAALLISEMSNAGPASVDTTGIFNMGFGRFSENMTNAANATLMHISYDGNLGPLRVDGRGNMWIGYDRAAVPTNSGTFGLLVRNGLAVGSSYQATTPPTSGAIIQGNVGIGTTSPADRLHVSGGGLQVGDSSTTTISLRLSRTNVGVVANAHYFTAAANTPVQSWIEGGFMTGERTGTVTAPNSGYPYYEEWIGNGSGTAKTFGFVNLTSGNFTSANLLTALALIRTGQIRLPQYTSSSSFTGTAVATLAVDSSGNVITVTGVGSESDTLATVTARGATTSTGVTFNGSVNTGGVNGIELGWTGSTINDQRIGRIRPISTPSQNPYAGGLAFDYYKYSGTQYQFYEGIRLSGAGYVGIGTASPSHKLHIIPDSSSDTIDALCIESNWGSISNHMVRFDGNVSGTGDGNILLVRAGGTRTDTEIFEVQNGSGTQFVVRGDGNVGIGTANPGYKLEVQGTFFTSGNTVLAGTGQNVIIKNHSNYPWFEGQSASAQIFFGRNGANPWGIGADATYAFRLWDSSFSANYFGIFAGSGNTAIGSSSDTGLAKLQVSGAIQQTSVTSSLLKTNASGVLVAAVAGTDYLTPTSSTFTYDASLTLTTNWQNTGVTSANLTAKGVYVVSCYANDYSVGGSQYMCTYTGLMFWYTDGTNSSSTITEIPLHHSGHHDGGRYIYLRTVSSLNADGKTYLQIVGNGNNSGASTYSFTFKRLL